MKHPKLLILGIALLFTHIPTQAAAPQKPNIILILVDDLGYSDLSCFGSEINTPNIDRLAANGLKFTQLYNSARCCPTRASLMTGLYPHQTGVGFMTADQKLPGYRGFLNDQCVTTASLLQQQGYKTYLAGKWHLRGKDQGDCVPTNRGFDEFYGPFRDYSDFYKPELYFRMPEDSPIQADVSEDFYATDAITDYALTFMDDARESEEPYYLYLAYNAPHFPLQAPQQAIDKYAKVYEKGWDEIRAQRVEKLKELGLISDDFKYHDSGDVPKVPNRNLDSPYYGKEIPRWDELDAPRQKDLARRMATFAAMVDIVDENVGRIIQDLKLNNELENTCIFFLSDNGACAEWDPYGFDNNPYPTNLLHSGEDLTKIGQKGSFHSYGTGWAHVGNTPLDSYKHYTSEGGISSPTIFHFPAQISAKGGINREPHHVMDIAATILDLAQAPYPDEWNGNPIHPLEGRSLKPVFSGETLPARPLYFEHEGNKAIRDGQWKLLMNNSAKEWELYNIRDDRGETQNLAIKHPEKVTKMSGMWHQWATQNFVLSSKLETPSNGMPKLYYTP